MPAVQRIGKKKAAAMRRIDAVVKNVLTDEDHGDATFGVITKVLGCNMLLVRNSEDRECVAKIYSKLLRGAKCWTPGAIVILADGTKKGEYEVEGILERKEAKKLAKDEVIPRWFFTMGDTLETTNKGVAAVGEDIYGFDFEEEEEEAVLESTAEAEAVLDEEGAPVLTDEQKKLKELKKKEKAKARDQTTKTARTKKASGDDDEVDVDAI